MAGYALSGVFGNNLSLEGLGNAALDSFLASAVTAFVITSVSYIKCLSRSKPVTTAELAQETQSLHEPLLGQQTPTKITGYTRHGLDQALFRDGHGVSPKGILDAVRNPTEIIYDTIKDTYKFRGIKSVTILNSQGKVVSTWAKSSVFWRY